MKDSILRTASRSTTCPPTTLRQCGVLAPSRSASHTFAPQLTALIAIFGSADPYTPAADIEALRAAWANRDDCEIVVYASAEHGFVHDPERPAHRAEDAADAWSRVLAFLGVE